MKLDGTRGSLDDFGEEKNNFLLPEFEALMLPFRTLVDILSAPTIVRL
jgi:hypothetical protein